MLISSEKDFKDYQDPVFGMIVNFKMVNIGPRAIEQASHSGAKICEVASLQPGFFILADTDDEIRKAMHDLVDLFCNAREGKQ